MEDRSRRNNIRLEGIPGSENEGWDVTEEKLKKVINDELDIENVVNERVHRVKRNNGNNENNDQVRKPTTVVKLLHFILKPPKITSLHFITLKSRTIRNLYFKEDFTRETLAISKGLWNVVVRFQEEGDNFTEINYDRIYSQSFWPRK